MIPVYISLDKERELKFGNKAIIKFKEITGKSILDVMTDLEKEGNFDVLVFNQMLYVALLSKNPDITSLEQVIDLVDDYTDINTLLQACMNSFKESGFFPNSNNQTKSKK